jgi:hypothetical protein
MPALCFGLFVGNASSRPVVSTRIGKFSVFQCAHATSWSSEYGFYLVPVTAMKNVLWEQPACCGTTGFATGYVTSYHRRPLLIWNHLRGYLAPYTRASRRILQCLPVCWQLTGMAGRIRPCRNSVASMNTSSWPVSACILRITRWVSDHGPSTRTTVTVSRHTGRAGGHKTLRKSLTELLLQLSC